jgi:nitroreductase
MTHNPVDELLTTTRAVRRRLDLQRAVEPEVILDCIRIAQQAPSGNNAQNWHFMVVTDANHRRKLGDIYREVAQDGLRQALEQAEDAQSRRVYRSAVYLSEVLDRVPVHVIPCIEGKPPPAEDLAASAGFWATIVPATWSFMLALRSRGLGTVWTTPTLARHQQVAELLDIPPGVTQTALIPVAYYTGESFSPARRPPAETVTSWNRWGQHRRP